ncbi:MAG: ATP-binding protein, partial [Thermoplasmata archaeon]
YIMLQRDHSIADFLRHYSEKKGNDSVIQISETVFRHRIDIGPERSIIIKYRPYAEEISGSSQILPLALALFFMVKGGGKRMIIIDEAGTLMSLEKESTVLSSMVRHSRHFETSIVLISQDVSDFSGHSDIIENSRNIFLFRQSVKEDSDTAIDFKNYAELKSLQGGRGSPYSECFHISGKRVSKIMIIASEKEKRSIDSQESQRQESQECQKLSGQ